MSALRFIGPALLALVALVGAAQAAAPDSAECKRDLMVADSLMRQSRERLLNAASAPLATQCPVWRQHVEAARKANAIQGRCQTGLGKSVIQAELVNTATEFEAQIKARCKGGL